MRKITTYPVIIVFLSCLLISGCIKVENTYTKEKIADSIVALVYKEYQFSVKAWLVENTVWIYLPLQSLFNKDMSWDKKQLEKLNKVMLSASRVLLSMRPRPQFLIIVATDIGQYGVDYLIITCVLDILKLQNQFISREEFFRRNIIKLENRQSALGDTEGNHILRSDLSLEYFISEQINQRIQAHFTNEPRLKDKFTIEKLQVYFQEDILNLSYKIQPKEEKSAVDVLKEIKKITAYVTSAYELKNLSIVKIENAATGEEFLVSKVELRDLLK